MSIVKDISIERIRRMPESTTFEDIAYEMLNMGEFLKSSEEGSILTAEEILSIPIEEISEDEKEELQKLREEVKRGQKFRLEDVMDELNV